MTSDWPALNSFWMGGFEGADHLDPECRPLDMANAHGHLDQLEDDYARAAAIGVRTVRESIGWRLCEVATNRFDFDRPLRMARCARREGLQILWTVMHYGTPADVDLHDDRMIDRFACFAAAAARALAGESETAPIYTLVNEISFLSWAISYTDLLGRYRQSTGTALQSTRLSGYAVKRRLVRATLAATEAVRQVDPRARFLQVEPLVHVVAPVDQPELVPLAQQVADYQWQTWDLLAGTVEPELGGRRDTLDLIGVNHYHDGQWEVHTERRLWWHERDPRRRGLHELMDDAWRRYQRPMIVSETSHVGAGRGLWLSDVASQVERARDHGLPVLGICLYPLIDRPDWSDASRWHHSGLWDVATAASSRHAALSRLLNGAYAQVLRQWQHRLPQREADPTPQRELWVFSRRRWDLMQHRTLHLMTQMAADHRILFIERPVNSVQAPKLVSRCPIPGVEVLQPHLRCSAEEFDTLELASLAGLLAQALSNRPRASALTWLCTPSALPLVGALGLAPDIYDCAQALASDGFLRPAQYDDLLTQATTVFAAGPALAQALSARRPDVSRLDNGVDAAHFDPQALQWHGSEDAEAARLLAGLTGPLLGHAGTFDDGVDYPLLAAIADARPGWHIVLIGPVEVTAGTRLPQRRNLHWLGEQPYSVLPFLLARLQICLLPLSVGADARGDPAQLLEYLAAGKPVVSVPIGDAMALEDAGVRIAGDAAGFVMACENLLHASPPEGQRQAAARVAATATHRSWRHAAQIVRQQLRNFDA